MIGIIGLGFVGLTTALGFCEKTEYEVYGCDKDAARVACIKGGKAPFHEPGLNEALKRHLGDKFRVANDLRELLNKCEVLFYCVGTPADDFGAADLSILEAAIRETFNGFSGGGYKVIVIKSTVPPGTTAERVTKIVADMGLTDCVGIANNPEFLREGFSWEDFTNPDRIVIGQGDDRSGETVARLYESFGAPVFRVSPNTAEFIKYLSNSLLAALISFSNEMSIIADSIGGISVKEAFNILHMDKRWSGSPAKMTTYAYPGCGYGGYCLPKDTQALYVRAKESGAEPLLLGAAIETNNRIKPHIINKITALAPRGGKIGILGLSFKPGSDDVRDTSAKYIIEGLINAGYTDITAHDPLAIDEFKRHYDYPILYEENLDKLISESSALVLLTGWPEYREMADKIKAKPFVDARYII